MACRPEDCVEVHDHEQDNVTLDELENEHGHGGQSEQAHHAVSHALCAEQPRGTDELQRLKSLVGFKCAQDPDGGELVADGHERSDDEIRQGRKDVDPEPPLQVLLGDLRASHDDAVSAHIAGVEVDKNIHAEHGQGNHIKDHKGYRPLVDVEVESELHRRRPHLIHQAYEEGLIPHETLRAHGQQHAAVRAVDVNVHLVAPSPRPDPGRGAEERVVAPTTEILDHGRVRDEARCAHGAAFAGAHGGPLRAVGAAKRDSGSAALRASTPAHGPQPRHSGAFGGDACGRERLDRPAPSCWRLPLLRLRLQGLRRLLQFVLLRRLLRVEPTRRHLHPLSIMRLGLRRRVPLQRGRGNPGGLAVELSVEAQRRRAQQPVLKLQGPVPPGCLVHPRQDIDRLGREELRQQRLERGGRPVPRHDLGWEELVLRRAACPQGAALGCAAQRDHDVRHSFAASALAAVLLAAPPNMT
mmetsp:Transcript_39271/g.113526  ORF Transcript_39271/g.113526 Transcript_39271/m.113526 type:complete len:469 (+) Transcript_39271:2107-3513(+)